MPLYSDMYHNYIGSTPTSLSYSQSPYSLSSYTPSYSSYGYTPPTPRVSSIPRFLPKLTTISETPLSKHRLAALSRISAPKSQIIRRPSPKYIAPKPRRIDTCDIDVSAKRFANRRISDTKTRELPENTESIKIPKDSLSEEPKARTTIRRDRALVRLRTVRICSENETSPPPEPATAVEIPLKPLDNEIPKIVDDPGYGSSERSSSGSWRAHFECEFDLQDKRMSPSKTPGESFLEKYIIKDSQDNDSKHYLTLDDVPVERRSSLRRRSGALLPSFKEICSDISSDKLTDDLNAGDLRRRASLIIEEEILNIIKSESGNIQCILEQQVSDSEGEEESEKPKSRKMKKARQKLTANTSIENQPDLNKIAVIEHVEIEETITDVIHVQKTINDNLESIDHDVDVKVKAFKIPLRKKKKPTDVENKTTCDRIMPTTPHEPTTKLNEHATHVMASTAETHSKDERTHAVIVNMKDENCDLNSKLDAAHNAIPGEVMNIKKSVKARTLLKSEVIADSAPKMIPLQRNASEDFWGMIESRETLAFKRRKQKVIDEQKQMIIENSWVNDDENTQSPDPVQRKSLLKDKKFEAADKTKTSVADTLQKDVSVDFGMKKQFAKMSENKIDSPQLDAATTKTATTDKVKLQQVHEIEVNEKPELSNLKTNAKDKDEMKPAPENVNDLKVGQKFVVDEKQINKSESAQPTLKTKYLNDEKIDATKSALTDDQNKNENGELQKAKPFKLQPVPDLKNKVTATAKVPNDKILEVKLENTTEEKVPDSPKIPQWKKKMMTAKDKSEVPKKAATQEVSLKMKSVEITAIKEVTEIPKNVDADKCKEIVLESKSKKEISKPKTEVKKELVKLPSKVDAKIQEKATEKPEKPLEKVKVSSKAEGVQTNVISPKSSLAKNETIKTPLKASTEVNDPEKKLNESSLALKKSTKKESLPKQTEALKTPTVDSDQMSLTDDKSKSTVTLDSLTTKAKKVPTKSAIHKKSSAIDQSLKTADDTSSMANVNDHAAQSKPPPIISDNKKKSSVKREGQNLETEEMQMHEKNLNVEKSTDALMQSNTDALSVENNDNKKSFGTLSKFPTLNNLNSIAMNDTSIDKQQQQHNDLASKNNAFANNTIENEQLIAKEPQIDSNQVSVAIDSSTKTSVSQIETSKVETESEDEGEESSYDDSEDSDEEMEKGDFDPQKKVKLDFAQLRKCYGKDETSKITLVARPRPLWKIKRNRHAKFSSSESESSDAEEDVSEAQSATADSANNSSHNSSTKSEPKQPKKKQSAKSGENSEISYENITALMPLLSVNDENGDNENVDDETKKKNRLSTSSHDSGFFGIGATAAKSPRKALGECNLSAANLQTRFVLINYLAN